MITKRQAAQALVKHIRPYGKREVLVPCFAVGGRFVLGRTIGNLHVPAELGLGLAGVALSVVDARFVLDLHHGSIVEVRYFHFARCALCIGYTARTAEYVTLPPVPCNRLVASYDRDHSDSQLHRHQDQGQEGQEEDEEEEEEDEDEEEEVEEERGHASALGGTGASASASASVRGLGRGHQGQGEVAQGPRRFWTWQEFCSNYFRCLPCGPLVVRMGRGGGTESGNENRMQKKETVIISVNDPYALSLCVSEAGRSTSNQARRIAPKRLLPRPTPPPG